ncbi:MAG: sigma-54 dependent transcriptional regulator [Gammaproteobacteria bacterium]|nr:sigma-54 dependent transcriptional regulator [Gammaproteobacteria bacterium]
METKQLLIIEDNQTRSHELAIIFEFIGETCIQATSQNWKQQVDKSQNLIGIFLGDTKDNYSINDMLKEIYAFDHSMPVVTLYDNPDVDDLPEKVSRLVVGKVNWPLHQNQVMETIHACQYCRDNEHAFDSDHQSLELFRSMIGKSNAMQGIRALLEQVAKSDANVMILGESGTGKEVAARNLHYMSSRKDGPFVPINCGAIPAELLESELFGHEKGAFTGAITSRKGRFELAQGGTIFLDEIGDMPLSMQVKLLRVLQEKTFEKVGGTHSIKADVRIIAATHRNLEDEVKKNSFREDLFYRLNVFPVEMPPLRHRTEDIPLLVNELIARLEREERGNVRLSPNAVQALMQYDWPGNVRELANLIERLCILFPFGIVDTKDLPEKYQPSGNVPSYDEPELALVSKSDNVAEPKHVHDGNSTLAHLPAKGVNLKEFVAKLEMSYIEQALMEEDWVVARAAKRLGMRRTTLVEKMRKYDMQKAG